VVFSDQNFYTYAAGEWMSDDFDPSGKGEESFFFLPLTDSTYRPTFVNENVWSVGDSGEPGLKNAPSGFVTSTYSIMPKLIVPSALLVDNGCAGIVNMYAKTPDGDNLFNWTYESSTPELATDFQWAGRQGARYVTIQDKQDTVIGREVVISLVDPPDPKPDTGEWNSTYGVIENQLVVTGAFSLLLNITPLMPAKKSPTDVANDAWGVRIELLKSNDPQVIMQLQSSGSMNVNVVGEGESGGGLDYPGNVTVVQLAESKGKEGPPQLAQFTTIPYLLLVYPVWNGIIVSSGVQDVKNVVHTASTYCPKLKGKSILDEDYSEAFNPKEPEDIEVGVGTGASNVQVDFGDKIKITAKGCLVEAAYQPTFFSDGCLFETWFLSDSDEEDVVEYTYSVYPIWTKNGTDAEFNPNPPIVKSMDKEGSIEGTEYRVIQWNFDMSLYGRWAGEIFGYYLLTLEENFYPLDNDNGSFALEWSGGSPGDPSSTGLWKDYIQSVTCSLDFDGSNGSVSVDKYGLAGQEAVATQCIGALELTVDDTDMPGTYPGKIFSGLAFGINEQDSADGSEWTVPLNGLEQKLEEIILINVPFFDGYSAYDVLTFLCNYGGIDADFTNAPNATEHDLKASVDPSTPMMDFKTGTSVLAAINEIMDDLMYEFVIRDGKIYFYELDPDDGLPISSVYLSQPDWEPYYPTTKIQNVDRSYEFEDLRNELVVLAMQRSSGGSGTDLSNVPILPRIVRDTQTTTPTIPWSRPVLHPVRGYLTDAAMDDALSKLKGDSKVYEVIGRTTIPGNAEIKPYHRWGDFVIRSVSHNVDLQSKTWTTDLEFASGRTY
jgi:hypothetical protein